MRAAVAAALLSAVQATKACGGECPSAVYLLAAGQADRIVGDAGKGHLALSQCCEALIEVASGEAPPEYPNTVFGDPAPKKTPGAACASFTDCGACTLFHFCVWGKSAAATADSCHAEHDTDGFTGFFSHACSGPGPEHYTGVEEIFNVTKPEPSVVPPGSNFTESPHMAYNEVDWPVQHDGFLPPHECAHQGLTAEEFKERYPSGLPGCGLYETGGDSDGHTTTDIVSDPRLPSETNQAGYPLAANIHLPDHLVGGGEWSMPQPEAGWVAPDFNGNGCVGGPCDAHNSASALGAYSAHFGKASK